MIIAISLVILTFTWLAWFRLDWSLIIIIVALPAYLIRFSIFGLPLTLLESFILIAAAIWVIQDFIPNNQHLFKQGKNPPTDRQPYPYSWEIITLLCVSLIGVAVAGWQASSLGIWKAYFFEPILLFILILNKLSNKKSLDKIVWAMAISAGVISLLAVYQKLTGQFISNPFWAAAETRRITSFFAYPNAVGLYLAPISFIILGWSISLKKIKPISSLVLLAMVILSWLAIYFAHSEGALAAVVMGLLAIGLLAGRRSQIITILIVVLTGTSLLFMPTLNNRLVDKLTLRDLSGEIRKQQWQETGKLLADGRALTGAGLNNYQASIAPYHQDGIFFNFDNIPNFDSVVWASSTLQKKYWQPVEIYLYPHNIFLNFWTELGLLGLALFIWIIAKSLITTWQTVKLSTKESSRYITLGILAAIITIVIHGLVDVPYFKNDLAALFWIIIAFSAINNFNQHQEELTTIK